MTKVTSPRQRSLERTGSRGRRLRSVGALLAACASAPGTASALEGGRAGSAPDYRVELRVDGGFLAVLAHELQKGRDGSTFDYRDEGGQDVLFPVRRFELRLELYGRHQLDLLYQPLDIATRETLTRAVTVGGTTYGAGTDLELLYRFPFYRATYGYAFWHGERTTLSGGAGLQIRNATIEFAPLRGGGGSPGLVAFRDVGLVPLLHLALRHELGAPTWLELEADGIYAPVSYINGDDNDVEGAILDADARFGVALHEHLDAFIAARYIGGGAQGSSDGSDAEYSSNWLHFFVLSLGLALH